MHERDWAWFIAHGKGREIQFAQVPQNIADFLNASTNVVRYRHDYAVKAVTKHGLLPQHFPYVFEAFDYGAAYSDRDRHVTFYHSIDGMPFQVTIKCAFENRLLYVATFYKQNEKEIARKIAKATLIRPQHEGRPKPPFST